MSSASDFFDLQSALYFQGLLAARSNAAGLSVIDTSGDDPQLALLQDDGSTRNAFIQAFAAGTLTIRNEVHGGSVVLQGETAGGVVELLFDGDPDGSAKLYYIGEKKFETTVNGVQVTGDQTSIVNSADTFTSYRMRNTEGGLIISTDGGNSVLHTTDANGGSLQNAIQMVRGGGVSLNYSNSLALRTEGTATQFFSTSTDHVALEFYQDDKLTRNGYLYVADTGILMLSEAHGQSITLAAEDAGGTSRTLFFGSPDGVARINYAGTQRIAALSGGAGIYSDGNTLTGSRRLDFYLENGTRTCWIGNDSSDILWLRSDVTSGRIIIAGVDSSVSYSPMFDGDPDGEVSVYYDGIETLTTEVDGIGVVSSTSSPSIGLYTNGKGAKQGEITATVTQLKVLNQAHGALVVLSGEDLGGTERTILSGDPDGQLQLMHNGSITTRTVSAATGGLEINNTESGGGFERALTESDLGQVGKATGSSNSTETLADVAGLTGFNIVSGETYEITLSLDFLAVNSGDSIDLRLEFSGAGNTGFIGIAHVIESGSSSLASSQFVAPKITFTPVVNNANSYLSLRATWVAPNSGTLKLQFAKGGATAGTAQIFSGSVMMVRKIA
jgi:hypothetical protein